MRIGGLGLAPTDSCYDPNRAWYVPEFWITDAECACIAQEGRPLGEQCASFSGVAQTMSGQVGTVLGAGSSAIGEGIGTGLGSGISNFANTVDLSGLMLLGIVGLAIYMMKR